MFRAILHDDEAYPDPLRFNPDRFLKDGKLDPTVRDPMVAAFGFGRRYVPMNADDRQYLQALYRVCVGRYMADATVWITIATTLATLNIAKAKNANGADIEVDEDYTGDAIS